MPRLSESLIYAGLELTRSGAKSLQVQIYEFFREAILEKRLTRDLRLPSTRALAEQWGVSRTTVVCVFEQLIAEGYFVASKGSGTRVADVVPENIATVGYKRPLRSSEFRFHLSRQGKKLIQEYEMRGRAADAMRPFRPGVPAVGTFPTLLWRRLSSQVWSRTDPSTILEMASQGDDSLRKSICRYVQDVRGVDCRPENVFVVTSTQHAISLICQVLLDVGDSIAIENPGYPRAFAAFSAHGAQLSALPIDREGAVFGKCKTKPKAIYVTPSCQYPLGVAMSLKRRLGLLDWARHHRAWIVEDDYASEFRYLGRPIPALQGLDTDGRVIYLGTFNKVFSPALRLGYMVIPDSLIEGFTAARSLIDRSPSFIDQAVMARFISGGHFGQHIRRMRTMYKEREAFLREILCKRIPEFDVPPVSGGMHLIAYLNKDLRDVEVCERLFEQGVTAKPISSCYLSNKRKHNALLLGFSGWDEGTVRRFVRLIEKAMNH